MTHRVLSQEQGLPAKGSDGDEAMERLAEVLKDGAEGQRVEPLELPATGDVQALGK
jgi:hypothetical protein